MAAFKFYLPRVRQSKTTSTLVLWGKSLLNAFLFLAIFMVVLPWVAYRVVPLKLPIPHVVGKWGGVFLIFAGTVMWIYCLWTFCHKGRGTPLMLDAPRNLVTSGLFGIVRNPIMVAELMVLWGEVLFFANMGILIYAFMISIIAHMLVVYVEEPELKGRFGREYEKYCQQVPRWFPGLKRKNKR
ncbi:MAG: isoprenylcysteine carboxylmethyltransferase family protein [Candidatus Kuenenia sp.]|nr:isoprenylcysteine carboxylmethyltransferase family protein [Candidatus Kuenenia hertensis]